MFTSFHFTWGSLPNDFLKPSWKINPVRLGAWPFSMAYFETFSRHHATSHLPGDRHWFSLALWGWRFIHVPVHYTTPSARPCYSLWLEMQGNSIKCWLHAFCVPAPVLGVSKIHTSVGHNSASKCMDYFMEHQPILWNKREFQHVLWKKTKTSPFCNYAWTKTLGNHKSDHTFHPG